MPYRFGAQCSPMPLPFIDLFLVERVKLYVYCRSPFLSIWGSMSVCCQSWPASDVWGLLGRLLEWDTNSVSTVFVGHDTDCKWWARCSNLLVCFQRTIQQRRKTRQCFIGNGRRILVYAILLLYLNLGTSWAGDIWTSGKVERSVGRKQRTVIVLFADTGWISIFSIYICGIRLCLWYVREVEFSFGQKTACGFEEGFI